ncbi:MAG: arginine--tRNA ligase [Alphaproteobacteria bacterium]|nr:arginine--tRNA ligase [Alphaproteobacteria bacterium]
MNIFSHFSQQITDITDTLIKNGTITLTDTAKPAACEPPRDSSHGDISTNYAMVMAKSAGMSPRDLAAHLVKDIAHLDGVTDVNIAGPGFINLTLDPAIWQQRIDDILAANTAWGVNDIGKGEKINVEYVSANPTGPLHAAHARGAIIGDSLANLLETCGYDVTREYYINDAGNQVDVLARSVFTRYKQALGDSSAKVADGQYPGEYLIDTGQKLAKVHGDELLNMDESEWLPLARSFAIDDMMETIKADLGRLNIHMDRFSSERQLVKNGAVDTAIGKLKDNGLIYLGVLEKPKAGNADDWEPREQLLFRSTDFGDDVDRAVKKSDDTWTYFASDIAYHLDKLERGSDKLINIWGADHGGYVKRMKSAVSAFTGQKDSLNIQLVNFVKLLDGGKQIKMSKRAGTFVTLSDVLDTVGKDILRFIMLTRRADQTMDFDYAEVTTQSRENPVFYVQYAHARACSVLRQDEAVKIDVSGANLSLLSDPTEMALIRLLASYPRQVEAAGQAFEPHRIAFYLMDLAAAFHGLWNKGRDDPSLRFITDNTALTAARLNLVNATAVVIRNGFAVLGVDAINEM